MPGTGTDDYYLSKEIKRTLTKQFLYYLRAL